MDSPASPVNPNLRTRIATSSPRSKDLSPSSKRSSPLRSSPSSKSAKLHLPNFPDVILRSPKKVILKGSSLSVCHWTSDSKPYEHLQSMEFQLDLILHQKTAAPWTRQLIEELLSDCHRVQDAAISITAEELQTECIRLTSNCRFVAERLRIDESLEDRIKEYQVMRFHNYVLGMGDAIPNTQEVAELLISSLSDSERHYDGGKWEFVYKDVEGEIKALQEWTSIDSGIPRPSTPVLDSVQRAATQCKNFSWEYFFGPLAEYVEKLKPENERKNCIILPGGKSYVQTETLSKLMAAGRWGDIACILVRNFHDLPNIVPLVLGKRIETFQRELKKFQDWHFKSITEAWSIEEKRYVARNYELHDWVLTLDKLKPSPGTENEKKTKTGGRVSVDLTSNDLKEQRENLRDEYHEVQLKWNRTRDDVQEAENEMKIAERRLKETEIILQENLRKAQTKLEEKKLVHKACGDNLMGVARKVEALDLSFI